MKFVVRSTGYTLAIVLICTLGVFDDLPMAEASRQLGEEVFSFDPGAITELSMRAEGLRLIAHRWKADGHPFLIAVFTRTGLETCRAGEGFDRALTGLQSLRTVRILSADETHNLQDSGVQSIRIRLTAGIDIEPGEWTFYLPSHQGAAVIGQSEHMEFAAELSVGRQSFTLLEQGCHGLKADPRHRN